MVYGLTQSTAPTEEPVTLAEAKRHLRVDKDDENADIAQWIETARELVEDFTGRQLCTATWTYKLDGFPRVFWLPKPPLSSVTSIAYIDTNGDSQTVTASEYDVDTDSTVGRVVEAYGESWPSTRSDIQAVTVTFVAGYGTAQDVPGVFKSAIRLLMADLHEHREARTDAVPTVENNPTVARLLWTRRVSMF